MPSSPPPRFYRPELDGLRFIAFFAVFVHHTFLFGVGRPHHGISQRLANALGTLAAAGAFGVDLFFVLSAYLITELLLRERDLQGAVDVPAFYARRILRIWPLYFFALAIALLLGLTLPGEEMDVRHLLAFVFFLGNWAFMAHPIASVAAPLWSVSVEEQFYLLWPWAVRRGTRPRFIVLAVAGMAVGATVRFFMARAHSHEPWFSKGSFTRVDGIAFGVLLSALLNHRLPRLGRSARLALASASLASLLWIAHALGLLDEVPLALPATLGWTWVGLACAGLVLAVLGDENGPGALLRHPALVYLGRISFGLYAYHQLALLLAGRLFPLHATRAGQWAAHFAVALTLTLMAAVLSFRWLEQPFLRLKRLRFTIIPSRPDAT
jgi:peptidoglycan/LPS O-acetylase OafA/YrhL